MPLGGSSNTFSAEDEVFLRIAKQAKDPAAALQSKGCGLFGSDANAPAQPFLTQLNSAQIRGFFYVDSRYADAPGHDYQAQ
jgi:hypothetical protein